MSLSANEALTNLKLSKKSQSILITGVTGSGKTETAKHIMEFLWPTKSDLREIRDTEPIFEAFGNAKTRANSNSSRFCKYVEVSIIFTSINFDFTHLHSILFIYLFDILHSAIIHGT